jgi:predicted nuclease of restriction endonuclease-like (RecB) superfamily
VTNFKNALPPEQSDLADEILCDPYNFDFLTLRDQAAERDLEEGLLAHIRKFLIELGAGFAFVGPEYVGKMNFYLSAVDDQLRHADDKLSIGLILCKTRSQVIQNMHCAI